MDQTSDNYTNCNWCFWYNNLTITKGTGGLESWWTSGDHPNYSIIENGQNTENNPGDLRRLAVTQTPVEDHQHLLMWKNYNNNNNNWNNQIKRRLELSVKTRPTNTWESWRLAPSNKWKWKTKFKKNISWERENYLRQNSLAETLSKE